MRLIYLINNTEPPRPRSVDPAVPRDIETIILRSVDKDPDLRYQSASDLAYDLQQFLSDEPIRARRRSSFEQSVRWMRRNRSLATALAGIVALGLLLAIVATTGWVTQTNLRNVADMRGMRLNTQNEELRDRGLRLQSQSDQLRRNLYFSEMNIAGYSALARFGMPTVRAKLDNWMPTSEEEVDLRDWEWHYLHSQSHREQVVAQSRSNWTWSADFHPDGSEFVHCSNGWGIQIRDAQTGRVLREKSLSSARYVDWNSAGDRIAVASFNRDITILDAQTLDIVASIGGGNSREVVCVSWSPDGTRIASTLRPVDGDDIGVHLWDSNSGELIRTLDGPKQIVWDVAWGADGIRLAAGGDDGVYLWNVYSAKPLTYIESPSCSGVCWNPVGSQILAAIDSSVLTIDAASGAIEDRWNTDLGRIQQVRWRPDRNQLALADDDGNVTLWSTEQARRLRKFGGHTGAVRNMKWSSDGSQLVTAGVEPTARTWQVDRHDETQVVPIRQASTVEWSNDGAMVCVASRWAKSVWTIETATGQANKLVDGERDIMNAAVSPDGTQIAYCGRDFLKLIDIDTGLKHELHRGIWLDEIAWHPSGRYLWSRNAVDAGFYRWDVDSGEFVSIDEAEEVTGIAINSIGEKIATSGIDGGVNVRDIDGTIIWRKRRAQRVSDIRWNHEGTQLATAEDGAIVIWDAATGEVLNELTSLQEMFSSIDWNPKGTRLVSGSPSSTAVWDPTSGHVALKLTDGSAEFVRWSLDGSRIAATGADQIQIWDTGSQ